MYKWHKTLPLIFGTDMIFGTDIDRYISTYIHTHDIYIYIYIYLILTILKAILKMKKRIYV